MAALQNVTEFGLVQRRRIVKVIKTGTSKTQNTEILHLLNRQKSPFIVGIDLKPEKCYSMWNRTWEETVTVFGWWELLCGYEDRRWDKIPDHITLMKTKTQHFVSHSQLRFLHP